MSIRTTETGGNNGPIYLIIGMSDGFIVPFLLTGILHYWQGDNIEAFTAYLCGTLLLLAIASGIAGYWAGRKQKEYHPAGIDSHEADDHHHSNAATLREMMEENDFSYDAHRLQSIRRGIIISIAYLTSGAIVVMPYFLMDNNAAQFYMSAGIALTSLFILGLVKGRFLRLNPWKVAISNVAVAALAALGILLVVYSLNN